MPELPNITLYIERLEVLTRGSPLRSVDRASPFFLRTVDPPLKDIVGKRVLGYRRLGKRIVMELEAMNEK